MYLPNLGLNCTLECNPGVQVQTQQPYQLRTYAWCWAIPPKCSRYKIQMKTVFKTEVGKASITSHVTPPKRNTIPAFE